MALKGIVREGDPTTGGGVVIEASGFPVNGRRVALVGDACTCRVHGHGGVVRIIEGSASDTVADRPMAYDGCVLSCGCRVMTTAGDLFTLDPDRDAMRTPGSSLLGSVGHSSGLDTAADRGSEITRGLMRIADVQTSVPLTAEPSRTPSGSSWCDQFPTSTDASTLADGFRQNVEAFISAMESAGASVEKTATYRPPERAYLMHWSWCIAKEGLNPGSVPDMDGVAIEWVHKKADGSPDLVASKAAAQDMVDGYGVVFKPSLTSRHTEGNAIDMNIVWSGTLNVLNANGQTITIRTTPRNGTNPALAEVGSSYGVIKLVSDPPHWSSDGH